MTQGFVKWFNDTKGYGFINIKGESEDIFVHYSQILQQGFKTLRPEELVEFDLNRGPKGLHATNVQPIESPE